MSVNPYAGLPNQNHSGRLGRGTNWDIQFSMDGKGLAVFSGTGTWLYDPQTLDAIAVPQGKLSFSIQSDEPILVWFRQARTCPLNRGNSSDRYAGTIGGGGHWGL